MEGFSSFLRIVAIIDLSNFNIILLSWKLKKMLIPDDVSTLLSFFFLFSILCKGHYEVIATSNFLYIFS